MRISKVFLESLLKSLILLVLINQAHPKRVRTNKLLVNGPAWNKDALIKFLHAGLEPALHPTKPALIPKTSNVTTTHPPYFLAKRHR